MAPNKVALITGGTDGMGKATAKKLLLEGWEVVIVGRNTTKCENTVAELSNLTRCNNISAIVADLSLLSSTKVAADTFLSTHNRLDFLFLNANTITQKRTLTSEGFESNFALGHLSRALLTKKCESILMSTPGSQILSVVGKNISKLDYDDFNMGNNFSAMKALGQWQWAEHLFVKEFNSKSSVIMNLYMPGLVQTKILKNEPQPMKFIVGIANLIIGIPTEKSADNVWLAINDVVQNNRKGVYYWVNKIKVSPAVNSLPEESKKLWDFTLTLLTKYL